MLNKLPFLWGKGSSNSAISSNFPPNGSKITNISGFSISNFHSPSNPLSGIGVVTKSDFPL
ncbi:hypothetical protein LguiA_014359 [Lonicera macranthoides]